MAYKKKKGAKQSRPHAPTMNRVSESLNSLVCSVVRGKIDLDEAKSTFFAEWESAKEEMKSKVTPKAISDADEAIQAIAAMDTDQMFSEGNAAIDAFRTQSDVSLGRAKNDIMFFWMNAAYKNTREWDIPWLRRIDVAEKMMPFYEKDTRYIFQGYVNQAILAHAIDEYREVNNKPKAENVTLTMGDIKNLLLKDFEVDPESTLSADDQKKKHVREAMKGHKSLTSIFVPRSISSYYNQDGTRWRPEGGQKRPSKEDIESGRVREYRSVSFISNPVWLVDSMMDVLPEDVKDKYDLLRQERMRKRDKERAFLLAREETDLDKIIDSVVAKHVEDMSIDLAEGGNSACYYKVRDKITVPGAEDFLNPVERYSTTAHELAHSTMHLAGRDSRGSFGTIPYAQEEIIAETTAMLMTHELRERLEEERGGELPDQWKEYFDEYYQNSQAYNRHWGEKFDFAGMLDQMFEAEEQLKGKNTDVFGMLMEGTLQAFQILKSGTLNNEPITKELRDEMKQKNLDAAKEVALAS